MDILRSLRDSKLMEQLPAPSRQVFVNRVAALDELCREGTVRNEGILSRNETAEILEDLVGICADQVQVDKIQAIKFLNEEVCSLLDISVDATTLLPFNTIGEAIKAALTPVNKVHSVFVHESIQTSQRDRVIRFSDVIPQDENDRAALGAHTKTMDLAKEDGKLSWVVYDLDNPRVDDKDINGLLKLINSRPALRLVLVGQHVVLLAVESKVSVLLKKMWETGKILLILSSNPFLPLPDRVGILVANVSTTPEKQVEAAKKFSHYATTLVTLKEGNTILGGGEGNGSAAENAAEKSLTSSTTLDDEKRKVKKRFRSVASSYKELVSAVFTSSSSLFEVLSFNVRAADMFRFLCTFRVSQPARTEEEIANKVRHAALPLIPTARLMRFVCQGNSGLSFTLRRTSKENSLDLSFRPLFDIPFTTSKEVQLLRASLEHLDALLTNLPSVMTAVKSHLIVESGLRPGSGPTTTYFLGDLEVKTFLLQDAKKAAFVESDDDDDDDDGGDNSTSSSSDSEEDTEESDGGNANRGSGGTKQSRNRSSSKDLKKRPTTPSVSGGPNLEFGSKTLRKPFIVLAAVRVRPTSFFPDEEIDEDDLEIMTEFQNALMEKLQLKNNSTQTTGGKKAKSPSATSVIQAGKGYFIPAKDVLSGKNTDFAAFVDLLDSPVAKQPQTWSLFIAPFKQQGADSPFLTSERVPSALKAVKKGCEEVLAENEKYTKMTEEMLRRAIDEAEKLSTEGGSLKFEMSSLKLKHRNA